MTCLGDREPLSEQNMETEGFPQAKVLDKGACDLPNFFNLHAEHSMRNTGLDSEGGDVKPGRHGEDSRCADGTIFRAEGGDHLK